MTLSGLRPGFDMVRSHHIGQRIVLPPLSRPGQPASRCASPLPPAQRSTFSSSALGLIGFGR